MYVLNYTERKLKEATFKFFFFILSNVQKLNDIFYLKRTCQKSFSFTKGVYGVKVQKSVFLN